MPQPPNEADAARQRKLREHTLVRTIVGWQRFQQLPPPPWPIAWILDEALLPAYFGKGFDAIKKFIHVLPAVSAAAECRPRLKSEDHLRRQKSPPECRT